MDFRLATTAPARFLTPTPATFAQYDIDVYQRAHPRRQSLERFIAEGYARAYGAHVAHFADVLVGLSRGRGHWVGGVGYTVAGQEPLFIEQYVDAPIEQVLSQAIGYSISRRDLVEVGNLFALGSGAARRIIVLMAALLNDLGRSWVVLTLTQSLLNSFIRLGIEPIALIPADPQRLHDQGASWGTYYSQGPCVMAANIRAGYARLAAQRFSRRLVVHAPAMD